MHRHASTLLVPEKLDSDLLELLAAELPMRIKRELRSDPKHLVHPSQQPGRLLDVGINLVHQVVQARRLLAKRLQAGCHDPAFLLDHSMDMFG